MPTPDQREQSVLDALDRITGQKQVVDDIDGILDLHTPAVHPDRKPELDWIASRIAEARGSDAGRSAIGAARLAGPDERAYIVRRVAEHAARIAESEPVGRAAMFGRSFMRGVRGVKRAMEDTVGWLTGNELLPEQDAFARMLESVRSEVDPSIPADTGTLSKWTAQAAEMAPPMIATAALPGGPAASTARKLAATGFWATQTFPSTLAEIRADGVSDAVGVPVALASSIVQSAVETLELDAIAPRDLIRKAAGQALRSVVKSYGKELGEEGIQALINETGRIVASRVDEEAPDRGYGALLTEAVHDTFEAAGPLAVMMLPSFGAAGARKAVSAMRLSDLQDAAKAEQWTREHPEEAQAFAEAESPSRTVVEGLIRAGAIHGGVGSQDERRQAQETVRAAIGAQSREESEPQAEAEPQADTQAEPQAEAEPDAQAQAEPQAEPQPQAELDDLDEGGPHPLDFPGTLSDEEYAGMKQEREALRAEDSRLAEEVTRLENDRRGLRRTSRAYKEIERRIDDVQAKRALTRNMIRELGGRIRREDYLREIQASAKRSEAYARLLAHPELHGSPSAAAMAEKRLRTALAARIERAASADRDYVTDADLMEEVDRAVSRLRVRPQLSAGEIARDAAESLRSKADRRRKLEEQPSVRNVRSIGGGVRWTRHPTIAGAKKAEGWVLTNKGGEYVLAPEEAPDAYVTLRSEAEASRFAKLAAMAGLDRRKFAEGDADETALGRDIHSAAMTGRIDENAHPRLVEAVRAKGRKRTGSTMRMAAPPSGKGKQGPGSFRAAHGMAEDFDAGAVPHPAGTPPEHGPADYPPMTVRGLAPPELVRLARRLQETAGAGKTIGLLVKNMRALGVFSPKTGQITIDPKLGKDPEALAMVLAHEIMHMADWLPDKTLARGNILGHIAALKNYTRQFLSGYPGGPEPLSEAEIKAFREEARRLAMADGERYVDEYIETRLPITPKDVLAIWQSVAPDVPTELLDYVKRLSAAEKKKLVADALKGIVPEKLQRFARVLREPTGRKRRVRRMDMEAYRRELKRLITEEIARRRLLENAVVVGELVELSQWWMSYDQNASGEAALKYRRYRESPAELYAQAGSVLLVAPKEAMTRAPTFWRAFWGWADARRELVDAYLSIQQILNDDPDGMIARHRAQYLENMATAEQIIRDLHDERERRRRSLFIDIGTALLDRFMPILSDLKKAPKDDVQARRARELLDEIAMTRSVVSEWLSRVQRDVVDPLIDLGVTVDQIGEYLAYRRITTQRADVINPEGITPEAASDMLRHMRQTLGPEVFEQLETRVHDYFDEYMFEAVNEAVESGVYERRALERLRDARHQYATFIVLQHVRGDAVDPELAATVGTFDGIANPFTQTVAKMAALRHYAARNRAKAAVVEFLKQHMPADIKVAVRGTQRDKPSPGMGFLEVMEDGRRTIYEVEQYVAGAFQTIDRRGLNRIGAAIGNVSYRLFYPLYVTYSVGWQVMNLWRDIKRVYKSLEAARPEGRGVATAAFSDLLRLLPAYAKAAPHAWRYARGVPDELVAEMQRDRALDIAMARYDWEDDSTQYERILARHGILPKDDSGAPTGARRLIRRAMGNKLLNAIAAIPRAVETMGYVTESMPKIAAYMEARKDITGPGLSYIVRNYIGTPNYTRKGTNTSLTAGIFMFSNVILQGIRADASLATSPKTAAGYWLRSMLVDFLPKTAMLAAIYGLFGREIAELFKAVPDHDKEKYLIVPLGWTERGKVAYVRIPHDDTNRVLCGILWQLGKLHKAEIPRMVSLLWGEIPNPSPTLLIPYRWIQFAAGRNPVDSWTGRQIVSNQSWTAGGWPAVREMIGWTVRQGGVLGTLLRTAFEDDAVTARDTVQERVFRSVPGLDRLIRISDRGLDEEAMASMAAEAAETAGRIARLDPATRTLLHDRYKLNMLSDHGLRERLQRRRAVANHWYRTEYAPRMEAIEAAEAAGDKSRAGLLMDELRAASSRILNDEAAGRMDEFADRLMVLERLTTLAAGMPERKDRAEAWRKQREEAWNWLRMRGVDMRQAESIWRTDVAAGRKDRIASMRRLRSAWLQMQRAERRRTAQQPSG